MAFQRLGSFWNSYLEKTILIAGLYLVRLCPFGKFERSAETAVGLFDPVIVFFLHLFLTPFFAAESQGIACNFDLDVFFLDAGKLSPDDHVTPLLEHIHRRDEVATSPLPKDVCQGEPVKAQERPMKCILKPPFHFTQGREHLPLDLGQR